MAQVIKQHRKFPLMVNDWFNTDALLGSIASSFGNSFLTQNMSSSLIPTNVIESSKDIRIELATPGLSRKDFKIKVEDNIITISAEKKDIGKNYKRREFSYNSFSRSFILPKNINHDVIDAKYEDGILRITIPKERVIKSNKKIDIPIT